MPVQESVTELVDAVFRANGTLVAAGDALTANAGLSAARWRILGALQDGPASVAAIARRRALRRQSARETMARLAADGFVHSTEDPDDARAPVWSLTPKARAALREIEAEQRIWVGDVAARLDAADVAAAIRLLERLMSATTDR